VTFAFFRTSQKHYHVRPPASSKAARYAWDLLSDEGELASLRLLDGLWMCKRADGRMDVVDASFVRAMVQEKEAKRHAQQGS